MPATDNNPSHTGICVTLPFSVIPGVARSTHLPWQPRIPAHSTTYQSGNASCIPVQAMPYH